MTQQAGLIVAAVIWWTVVAGLIALGICTYALVMHDGTPPPACVVGPGRECPVKTVGGDAQAYYVEWLHTAALASATPSAGKGRP